MTASIRRTVMIAALFSLQAMALLPANASAGASATVADGKADGTLTVNGKVTKVAFAYAHAVPGFFDKTKTDVEVILSDVALDAKALGDEFARMDMAKSGKLHAFEITIDAQGAPISTTWRHDGFNGPTPSGLSSADVFTKRTFDGKTVDASYKSAAPEEFFGNTYAFDVSFRAAIAH